MILIKVLQRRSLKEIAIFWIKSIISQNKSKMAEPGFYQSVPTVLFEYSFAKDRPITAIIALKCIIYVVWTLSTIGYHANVKGGHNEIAYFQSGDLRLLQRDNL